MPLPAVAAGGLGAAAMRAAPTILSNATAIFGAIQKNVPSIEDEVTVEVVGQPGATKQQLYYLGLATACGLVRRRDVGRFVNPVSAPPGFLMVEYDAADHWVRVTLRYKTSITSAVAGTMPAGFEGNLFDLIGEQLKAYFNNAEKPLPLYQDLVVYSGPKEEVVGADFNFTGGALTPGIPTSTKTAGIPKPPFAGRTILTTAASVRDPVPGRFPPPGNVIPSPNPRPPGDNRSRGAVVKPISNNQANPGLDMPDANEVKKLLVPLIYTALSDPGGNSNLTFQPAQQGPVDR